MAQAVNAELVKIVLCVVAEGERRIIARYGHRSTCNRFRWISRGGTKYNSLRKCTCGSVKEPEYDPNYEVF